MNVRPAVMEDISWIVDQLMEFDRQTGHDQIADREYLRIGLIPEMIRNHVMLIAEAENGIRCGVLGAMKTPHLFNPGVKMLSEVFWWVDPKARGCGAGARLLIAYDNLVVSGYDMGTVSLLENSRVRDESLEELGFKRSDSVFLKVVPQ